MPSHVTFSVIPLKDGGGTEETSVICDQQQVRSLLSADLQELI